MRSVVLTGFMGAGKTTVGKVAARELGMPHYDTDGWMAERGINIPELVSTNEPEFRRKEVGVLKEIIAQGPSIIATGGGIVSTEAGRIALKNCGLPVAWLRLSFEHTVARVAQDSHNKRPLFSRERFDIRQPWYRETATHVIDATQPVQLITDQVIRIARGTEQF